VRVVQHAQAHRAARILRRRLHEQRRVEADHLCRSRAAQRSRSSGRGSTGSDEAQVVPPGVSLHEGEAACWPGEAMMRQRHVSARKEP
jgi:hypothetical protein